MDKNIFEISDLNCAYTKPIEKKRIIVLNVKELNIPAGKMVFIIGPSGIGKSTILETLGIMNNTLDVNPDSKFLYYPSGSDEPTSIIDLLKRNKDKELSAFRRNNFSFIFQQTNLMRNFSAYQNVMVTGMLQGYEERESEKRTKEIFEEIKLPEFDTKYNAALLSGGQQQKLAYARAILPNFKILFGDEPTGNLDLNNARLLVSEMKKIIESQQSTVIIVSHDLRLAVRFADVIIEIQAITDGTEDKKHGLIDLNSVYSKTENGKWSHLDDFYTNDELVNHLEDRILEKENKEEPLLN